MGSQNRETMVLHIHKTLITPPFSFTDWSLYNTTLVDSLRCLLQHSVLHYQLLDIEQGKAVQRPS